ncbi:hypothetical protein FYK55_03570 [Roseiconus nitratireducens]|uniref:Uncharacterized protein n=1 Tax=Roseiconus nitratireducens TaxID=2605748 RepID=A0A5M6DII9_9BACT|nr:hypothetical protein [Roseiconus nitratireducens]KAA5545999.1 hypothetical protein FYK55_03570 [Roseiconus nitratireducens]
MQWRIEQCVLFTVLILSSSEAHCQFRKQDPRDNDLTGPESKVFDGIAELVSNRDKASKRFAFVAMGEKHFVGREVLGGPGDQPVIIPFYAIQAADQSKQFHFYAYGRCWDSNQLWKEMVRSRGSLKIADGIVNGPRRYQEKPENVPEDRFLERNYIQVYHFDPFDDIVDFGNQFESIEANRGSAEKVFFQKSELVSAVEITRGNVKSHWKYGRKNNSFDLVMVQSAVDAYLPIEVRFSNGSREDFKGFFSHARIHWMEHDQIWVPKRVEIASVLYRKGKPETHQTHMMFHWLVGDEVPHAVFDFDSVDFREPLREHFDLEFDHFDEGHIRRAPDWVTPDDLFIDREILIRD